MQIPTGIALAAAEHPQAHAAGVNGRVVIARNALFVPPARLKPLRALENSQPPLMQWIPLIDAQ